MKSRSNESGARSLLQEACARNTTVDVQWDAGDGTIHTARCRMLALTDGELFLDEPQAIGSDTRLRIGTPITAYFMTSEARFAFDTKVSRRGVSIMLNTEKRVAGIVVTMPRRVSESQRRNDFRVSMLHRGKTHVILHSATPDADTAPLDGLVADGAIVNLSAGGAAVTIGAERASNFTPGDPVYLNFELAEKAAGDEETYRLRAEIRQVRPIADGTAVRIGLQFMAWPTERDFRRSQDRLRRALTQVERERLKKAG